MYCGHGLPSFFGVYVEHMEESKFFYFGAGKKWRSQFVENAD